MRKIYRLFYGSMLLALGMSYIIGLFLSMMSDPYPYQNSGMAPMLSILPVTLMVVVGVMMVFVWFGMSGDDEDAIPRTR